MNGIHKVCLFTSNNNNNNNEYLSRYIPLLLFFVGVCEDINECDNPVCHQVCVNTPGSYHCDCVAGLTLSSDTFSCEPIVSCATSKCDTESQLCAMIASNEICFCKMGFTPSVPFDATIIVTHFFFLVKHGKKIFEKFLCRQQKQTFNYDKNVLEEPLLNDTQIWTDETFVKRLEGSSIN